MSRLLVFATFGVIFINISCERCMRCRYSYTETIIVETPDGEEEEKVEYTDLILLDEDGDAFGEECVKNSEYKASSQPFTIRNYYFLDSASSDLENYTYTCTEL